MIADQIKAVVAAHPFGTATASKRGRNPRWPYVPIVMHGDRSEQIRARAFRTRDEAVEYARATIEARREHLEKQLSDPRCRALREQLRLPRDL